MKEKMMTKVGVSEMRSRAPVSISGRVEAKWWGTVVACVLHTIAMPRQRTRSPLSTNRVETRKVRGGKA